MKNSSAGEEKFVQLLKADERKGILCICLIFRFNNISLWKDERLTKECQAIEL